LVKISASWLTEKTENKLEIAFLKILASDVAVDLNELGVFMEDL